MKKIYPAILEKEVSAIARKVKISEKLSKQLQIDICDGIFVPSKTFGSTGKMRSFIKLKKITKNVDLELDMMVSWNEKSFDKWINAVIAADPKSVIIHLASAPRDILDDIFTVLKKERIKIGLGVGLKDRNSEVVRHLPIVDYIQIMGIEKVGYSGQKLSPKALVKIKHFIKRFPKLYISVDGGVKEDNLDQLFEAGVSLAGANSMVFKDKNPERFFQ